MGVLVEGEWRQERYKHDEDGRFVRADSVFRDQVSPDVDAPFPAEAGRYHLYVSYACPWAHRTLIVRALKGLEGVIGVSVVHWLMRDDGWTFHEGPGVIPDPHLGVPFLRDLYVAADPQATGRVTVPVLWDTHTNRIVNNESSEIIRMLGRAFDAFSDQPELDLYPEALRAEIDAINERVYDTVNNGVYKAGFAGSQQAHAEAITALFDSLAFLEERLSTQRWLVGDQLTEADIRLVTTLFRFDPVYATHFKCNVRRLVDFPNLWAYTRELAQHPRIAPTIRLDHIKRHYYESHTSLNPLGIVPLGPELDWDAPHDRERLGGRDLPR